MEGKHFKGAQLMASEIQMLVVTLQPLSVDGQCGCFDISSSQKP